MGKGRKSRRKDDDDDDWMNEMDALRAENDAVQGDEEEEGALPQPSKKNKKKGKKGKNASRTVDSDDEDEDLKQPVKGKSAFAGLAIEDSEEEDEDVADTRPSKAASAFAALAVDEDEEDEDEGEQDDVAPKSGNGLSSAFAALAVDDDDDEEEEEEEQKQQKPDQKKAGSKAGKKDTAKQELDAELEGESVVDDDSSQGPVIKTAAQKKAEKKERERQKKEQERAKKAAAKQRAKEKKKQEEAELEALLRAQGLVEDSQPSEATSEAAAEPKADEPSTAEAKGDDDAKPKSEESKGSKAQGDSHTAGTGKDDEEDEDDDNDQDADTSSSNKKKKKKKKKKAVGEEPEAKSEEKTKKPSKMALALKKQMEQKRLEEERLRKEREEEERRLEELRRQEEEELLKEEERRQRKKQQEKERRARLRAEGKAVSKAEKEREAMQKLKLEQMMAMGIEVPALSNADQKKKPVYGKKKKKPQQKKSDSSEDASEATAETKEEPSSPVAAEEETKAVSPTEDKAALAESEKPEEEEEQVQEEVADDWEEEVADSWEEVADEAKSGAKSSDAGAGSSETAQPAQRLTQKDKEAIDREAVQRRIEERREKAKASMDLDKLRSPVCAVLGHVDTGKTKILDRIRSSNVQDGEAGGITQQIGATYIPVDEIQKQTKSIPKAAKMDWKVPGLLVIDTPGHESFSNLRSRGSSLCNIAVLVVDIMHGIEPQTAESIELLRKRKAPFIIALNKVDRIVDWRVSKNAAIQNTLKKQKQNTMQEFETRVNMVKLQFAEKGINTELYYNNKDLKSFVNIVPTSAVTGEGIPDLLFMLVFLTQKFLAKHIAFTPEVECTVLERKEVQGYGMTIDVILTNGTLREGDTMILCGLDGPIVTTARSLLMPAPMKELRVKNAYIAHKEIRAAQGVKIAAKELDKAVAGLPLFVAESPDEVEVLKDEASKLLEDSLNSIKTKEQGVCVQASTLGSLEALLEFLKTIKIPVSTVNIGPVHKRDVTRATIQLQRDRRYAVILAFDVPVDRDAQLMADREGVKIFTANIIYHLEDAFRNYLEEVKRQLKEQYRYVAVFPCRLKVLPDNVFNARNPIVVGVRVEEGLIREGTPLVVPSKEFLDIGVVRSIQSNHEEVEVARAGQEVCIKIEPVGEKRMYGRHFDHTDELVSKLSRESIDACKNYFREDLSKDDWKLVVKLKKKFNIL